MSDLTRWLSGGMGPDEAMDRETLRLHVTRQITCPIKGTLLDIKRTVLIEIGGGGQVVSAQAWDELAVEILTRCAELGITPHVVDGRLMVWGARATDYEELGIYRDVLNKFAGDEAFARWCANRFPWGGFDVDHERRTYELLRRFAEGDAVRLWRDWEELTAGTTGRTVGRPYELYRQAIPLRQFIELPDRRRVVVPLTHLEPDPNGGPNGGPDDGPDDGPDGGPDDGGEVTALGPTPDPGPPEAA